MRRIMSCVIAVTLFVSMNAGVIDYSDFTSNRFWSNAGEWSNFTISEYCNLSQASFRTVYYDESESTNPCIAFQISIRDNEKCTENALRYVSVNVLFKNNNGVTVDEFYTNAVSGDGSLKGTNGTFSYSWSYYSSSKQGIYSIYFIYNNLNSLAKNSPITAEIRLCDSKNILNVENGKFDHISFPKLSISENDETVKSKTPSEASNKNTTKHSWASTTHNDSKSKTNKSKSGGSYSGKVKLGSNSSDSSGETTEFEEYSKNDVITPQEKEKSKRSAIKVAEICAGAVALGGAVAIIISVVLKKHKNGLKVSTDNETENK